MRFILPVLILTTLIFASEDSLKLYISHDGSENVGRDPKTFTNPVQYKVISDDSSFIKMASEADGKWEGNALVINFGPYDKELTYCWYSKYYEDDWQCIIDYTSEVTQYFFEAGN